MTPNSRTCRICGGKLTEGARAAVCPACLLSAAITADPEEPVPEAFKNYDILVREDGSFHELGRGAMGVTYKAIDKNLHSPVAIKVIHAPLLDHSGVRERFIREARSAARLQHPNVASVFHLETDGPTAFYVMEYVDGETLDAVVRRKGRLSPQVALYITSQITRALAAADKQQLVHRDIKPSNIMVKTDEDGGYLVKVIDFGLAKLRDAKLDLTHGQFVGTPQYASPEQFTGDAIDIRSDIYAVGLTLWHMLTGAPPIPATDETIEPTLRRALRLPFEELNWLPRPVRRLLRKMLDPDPGRRPQNPPQLLLDIKECQSAFPLDPSTPWASVHDSRRHPRWPLAPIAATLVVASAIGATGLFVLLQPASRVSGPSLVVLQLENLSGNPKDAWFSSALTEEITTKLAQIPTLKVVSRAPDESYLGMRKRPPEIGREMGVSAVLEGSASRQGNAVRISTRLIDVATDRILTAVTYDREMKDIFGVQADLARKISVALRISLNPEQIARFYRKPTENLTAYDFYLQGKAYSMRSESKDNERAIALFQRAIRIDPNYALAYAGLAGSYFQRISRIGSSISEINNAETAARKAVDLDPQAAEAYSALGTVLSFRGLYTQSAEAFKKAISLNPNHFYAIYQIGASFRETGHLDEALPWFQKAVELAPQNPALYTNFADLYVVLGDPKRAANLYTTANALQPEQPEASLGLCRLHLLQGHSQIAQQEIEGILTSSPDFICVRSLAAEIALFAGDYIKARQLYAELVASKRTGDFFPYGAIRHLTALGFLEMRAGASSSAEAHLSEAEKLDQTAMEQSGEYASPVYDLAAIEAIRGNRDAAFALLEKSIAIGWTDHRSLALDPRFEKLRTDVRFQKIVSGVKRKVEGLNRKIRNVANDSGVPILPLTPR